MIQSLHRAFDILEYLAQHPDQPEPLGQIAEATGLNLATCANLIKTLMTRSYIEQVGPREGYLLGPMAHYLVRHGSYGRDIVAVAEPLLAGLATEVREHLVLSRLQGTRLFMLSEAEGDEVFQVRRDLTMVDDAYRTANGRLLLAYLSAAELTAFLRQKGVPGAVWPDAATEERLRQQLGAVRQLGRYIDTTPEGLARASFPIWQHGKVVAALGMYAPRFRFVRDRKEKGLKRLEEAAHEISKRLEQRPNARNVTSQD